MTNQEAFKRGQEHADSGKQLTPFDCRDFDKELFALCKTADRPFKVYAQLRGKFNKGWEATYFQQVTA